VKSELRDLRFYGDENSSHCPTTRPQSVTTQIEASNSPELCYPTTRLRGVTTRDGCSKVHWKFGTYRINTWRQNSSRRQQDPPKCWYPTTSLYGVTTQDRSSRVHRNFGVLPHHYKASRDRKPRLESSLPWKSKVLHLQFYFYCSIKRNNFCFRISGWRQDG